MGTRPKLFLLFFAIGVIPVVALSVVNYLNGVRTVESQLLGEVEREARIIAREVESRLREREDALIALARSAAVRDYIRSRREQPLAPSSGYRYASPLIETSPAPSTDEQIPEEVQGEVRAFIQSQRDYLTVTCLDARKQPLFRAEKSNSETDPVVIFKTRDFLPASLRPEEKVWSIGEQTPLRSSIRREAWSILPYTIPVFIESENASAERGALIVELKIDGLLNDAAGNVTNPPQARISESSSSPRFIVVLDRVLDRKGEAIYHPNSSLKYLPVMSNMPPSFKPIADAMVEGQSGLRYFKWKEESDWVVAYQPLKPLELSIAVAGDYSAAVRPLHRAGWLSIGLIVLVGLITAALLFLFLRRTARSIERVTEGAVAIAGGNLNERIEVRSSDETHRLAETFNAMSDRLREQIAREAESRQFESFMRLSAMLTHDLKNSILALSLLVNNMEQQFDREEFRADAMLSLTEATDKLRTIVAKLSEPVRSLSGEFKRPRPIDLIPIIRRALSRTAQPAADMHEIDIQLPESLVAFADDERIEKVVENLAINALEAMGTKRGRLSVKAGPAEEGFIFFSVSDTGPGMTEEFQRTRLFRPFATTKPKGVGLGLYTCRELVRALGGRVEVESERGSGTTFRIVLPSSEITEASKKSSRTR